MPSCRSAAGSCEGTVEWRSSPGKEGCSTRTIQGREGEFGEGDADEVWWDFELWHGLDDGGRGWAREGLGHELEVGRGRSGEVLEHELDHVVLERGGVAPVLLLIVSRVFRRRVRVGGAQVRVVREEGERLELELELDGGGERRGEGGDGVLGGLARSLVGLLLDDDGLGEFLEKSGQGQREDSKTESEGLQEEDSESSEERVPRRCSPQPSILRW